MSALRANPAPLLPSHVGVVIGLAVAKNLNSFSLQLFHRPRHVIRAETEVMNMLPHLFQAIAKRSAGAGLNELNRSEEHTSELQSLMRISYAVFCLKKQKHNPTRKNTDS